MAAAGSKTEMVDMGPDPDQPPDAQHVVCSHSDLQPLLANTAYKRNVQELNCLQNINHIGAGQSKLSRFYPVQDQNQRITRNSWKTEVGLGFITFVEDIAGCGQL